VFLNSACARTDRPWIDGGIEVLQGIARGFHAPATACYECTMSSVDWDLLNKRRSCSLLARRALEQRGTPTTPTTASIIGAIQAQEAVKLLHGMEGLMGRGFVFEGAGHNSYTTSYPINPECQWHYHEPVDILTLPAVSSDTPLKEIVAAAGQTWLGECDALDLSRELVERLECPACHSIEIVWQPLDRVDESRARCTCGAERVPHFVHSIPRGSALLEKSPREIGLPKWDIIWARRGLSWLGCEIAGDNPFAPCAG
jgi:adenylyltransferase/sulfurtransferase